MIIVILVVFMVLTAVIHAFLWNESRRIERIVDAIDKMIDERERR